MWAAKCCNGEWVTSWVACLSTHAYAQIAHCRYLWVRLVLACVHELETDHSHPLIFHVFFLYSTYSFMSVLSFSVYSLYNSYSFFFCCLFLFYFSFSFSTFHLFFISLFLFLSLLYFPSLISSLFMSPSFLLYFFLTFISSALLFYFTFFPNLDRMRQLFLNEISVRVKESTEGHCITISLVPK